MGVDRESQRNLPLAQLPVEDIVVYFIARYTEPWFLVCVFLGVFCVLIEDFIDLAGIRKLNAPYLGAGDEENRWGFGQVWMVVVSSALVVDILRQIYGKCPL
jgi:hypothetical protein